ncbi:MAG: hypothetical protein IKQ31_01105 [Clostridia bacterium]|nr:hypothetical protein [Clostridia bacterium]
MESKSTNYRYYIIGAIVVVALALLTILIVKIASNDIPEIDVDNNSHNTQNDTIQTYSSTDVTSSNVTTGKIWTETNNNMTTMIARPADNYMFGYWNVTVNSTTKKYSAMDTIVVPSETASNYTAVFISNSKILHITTLAQFSSNATNASYDMFVLDNDIDATGVTYSTISDFYQKIFDGNGHVIRNLSASPGGNENFGGLLKGATDSVVKNLTLDNCSIVDTGSTTVKKLGGIVGHTIRSIISNCVFRGTVKTTKSDCSVGAFIGAASGNTATSCIENCTYQGAAIGGAVAGMMIGSNPSMACILRNNKSEGSAQGPIS